MNFFLATNSALSILRASLLKHRWIAIIVLASAGFVYLNVYPIIRLHFDGYWGSDGFGWSSSYGYPLTVGNSGGCFTGPGYYYGNFAINYYVWAISIFAIGRGGYLLGPWLMGFGPFLMGLRERISRVHPARDWFRDEYECHDSVGARRPVSKDQNHVHHSQSSA